MNKSKEEYAPEFGKTLSSGISALVKGKQDYYILEHLVGSHYHQAGEKQEIMLDEVILGRDTDCHVRFDESFTTVSRHHASIVKDGDNWRLKQLSQKNTTFLNGKAIQDSWYLQSGDEIQLAVNGPKLVFRIPTETTEFKFSQRLNSFKQQVIRPYRTAFIIVCSVIVLLIAGGVAAGLIMKHQHDIINQQGENIEKLEELDKVNRQRIENLFDQLSVTNEQLKQAILTADSAQQAAIEAQLRQFKAQQELIKAQKDLKKVESDMKELNQVMEDYFYQIINGSETQYIEYSN